MCSLHAYKIGTLYKILLYFIKNILKNFSFFRFFKNLKIKIYALPVQISCTNTKIEKKTKKEKKSTFFLFQFFLLKKRVRTGNLYRKRTFFEIVRSKNDDLRFGRCRVLSSFGRFSVFGQKWSCFLENLSLIYCHISKKHKKTCFF